MITGRQLFDWPTRHHVHLVLPLMLIVSFGLHAVGVVVFRASHPRSQPSPERPAQIWFLPPGSPEAAKVMPMLEASDPALFSPGQISARDITSRPDTAYVPSFDSESPALAPMPPEAKTVLSPVGPVIAGIRPESRKRTPPPKQPGIVTMLKPGGGLAGREVALPADAAFQALARQDLLPLEFLVSVSPQGRPLYLFPMNTSGNESIDREALQVLARARFSSSADESDPVWGTATFFWGVDVHREKAR